MDSRDAGLILPRDEHNARLIANVHPPDWKNPTPEGRYNLVVIGAGTAGLITAAVAGSLGARVALIERHLLGGDCLNVGCVPSKALIRAGRMAHEARRAGKRLGLPIPDGWQPDFAAAMEGVRAVRARISHEDSAQRYTDDFGVDVYIGDARFTGADTVEVAGQTLHFARAVIATGARAAAPPIPGLEDAGYLTNETLFTLTERPARFGVIGAGPIGCEMAQAFRRLGSEVFLFERDAQILTREDPDAAAIVQEAFRREGIELVLGGSLEGVERRGEERIVRVACDGGKSREIRVDALLVGAGRTPNVEGLGLEAVGVEFDARQGVRVNDRLATTNPKIFAAGDVCMRWKFTHAADAAAKIVVQNALFFGRKKLSDLVMPWCTYTDPEIAHVGLYPRDAAERGIEIDTHEVAMERSNRAVTDGETEGFVRVHVKRGKDEIVGATVVASHAGDLISELTLAITNGVGLGKIGDVIHPYPTQAEAIKLAAGSYTRTRLTPTVKRVFDFVLALRR